MSRPARTRRSKNNLSALTDADVRALLWLGNYEFFDGEFESLEGKWNEYREQLLKEHSKPGFRPYAFWFFDLKATHTWINWRKNIPLAERRKYRTKNGKVISNREYFKCN